MTDVQFYTLIGIQVTALLTNAALSIALGSRLRSLECRAVGRFGRMESRFSSFQSRMERAL
jgi:hypothetical protein